MNDEGEKPSSSSHPPDSASIGWFRLSSGRAVEMFTRAWHVARGLCGPTQRERECV
jgi:hypothetical protein